MRLEESCIVIKPRKEVFVTFVTLEMCTRLNLQSFQCRMACFKQVAHLEKQAKK